VYKNVREITQRPTFETALAFLEMPFTKWPPLVIIRFLDAGEKILMDWIFKDDDYSPPRENKNYIDKSALSILGILSRIRQNDKSSGGWIYRLTPVVKFVSTFILIVLIALSRSFAFVILIDSYCLLLVSFLILKDIKKILMITSVVFIFSCVLLIPSVFFGNMKNSLLISLKIIGTVVSLNILTYTTKWRHITASLKIFFVPDIFILIMDMAIKYIVIFGDFSVNMLYALKKRSVGYDIAKHTSLSNLIGVLFLKAKENAEETYFAMECRGFTGEYKAKLKFKLYLRDCFFILINIIIIFLFFTMPKG
jgi:cobalt/nickel transport system permease protein